MKVVVEPASRTASPQALANLLWSTDPILNGYMFGTMPTLHKLINAEWPGDKGLFSHKQAMTASQDGNIVGLLIGHTEKEYVENFDFSVILQPEALDGAEADHIELALYWMDRLFPVPRPGSYYILEFAVSPLAQGAGVAGQLYQAAKAQALAQGCTQICLDVAANNDAVSFYQHLGFHIDVETRVPILEKKHGIGVHLHMVCNIALEATQA